MVGLVLIALIGSLLWLRVSRTTEWITLRLVVSNDEWWWEGSAPQWWYVEELSVGQTASNTFGETMAEITDIYSFDVGSSRRRAFIDLKVKGYFDNRREVYMYNYQPLQIGKPLDLTFGKNNLRGLIAYIENDPEAFEEKTIQVHMPAVRSWVAQSYKEGLEMKDSRDRVLAKIISRTISPTHVMEVTEFLPGYEAKIDPSYYYDVTLTVSIKTYKSGDSSYFVDRSAVKVGERIWFQFPETVAREAEITSIIE